MAYESKPGDAVAWGKKPEDNPKGPDFKGSIIAHRDIKRGERISLALWTKDAGRGTFLSGKVEDFKTRQTPTSPRSEGSQVPANPPGDDPSEPHWDNGPDIPF